MFVRVVTSRQHTKTYRSLQICESYRDPSRGGVPRTRVLAHVGQVDRFSQRDVDSIINGLLRVFGRPSAKDTAVVDGKDFGHIYALGEIWKRLGIGEILRGHAGKSGHEFDLEAHVKLMVFNRLCDPCSKLALLEWADGVYLPGLELEKLEYHHLLRTMDWLIEKKETVEKEVSQKMLTLFDGEPDLVFYDVTSSYFEAERSVQEEDIRQYGYSRDHRPERRQIVIGLVMTRNGLPLAHHVFPGDRPDKKTVAEAVRDLKERFGIRRAVFVGDRGMMSEENLDAILDAGFDYLISLPMRHSKAVHLLLKELEGSWKKDPRAAEQFHLEQEEGGYSLAVAFDPALAAQTRSGREERLKKADRFIEALQRRLKQEVRRRGRPLTAQGAFEQIHDYLRDRKLLRYYRLELTSEGLEVTTDEAARKLEQMIDGKIVVESSCQDLTARDLIERYKELADIERAFRTLKSSLEIRPVYHWTEKRIRAHVFICVLALQVHRYMRKRLQGSNLSVERSIQRLRTLKAGTLQAASATVPYLAAVNDKHKEVYEQLELPLPRVKNLEAAAL
ncbi:MAG: IS1634 family transposase [bacterium]